MISGINRSRFNGNSFSLLILILLAGLVLRIFLSSFWTYEPDFSTWTYWGNGIREVGFSGFYDKYWCDYMPGYLYVLWFLQLIHSKFQQVPVEILFKLPANLADFGISVLIFYALEKITTSRNALLSSTVYFFNPASLSNSVFWGQVDSVHALPILFSIILVLQGRFIVSGILASLAFMIKPQSFVIFPILGVVSAKPFFNKQSFLKVKALIPTIKIIVAMILTIFVLTIPFVADKIHSFSDVFREPVLLVRQRFDFTYSQYKYTSLNAFNFWGMVAMWKSDAAAFMNVTYQTWGTIIFAFIYALIFGLLFSFVVSRKDEEYREINVSIYYGAALVLFALFLFITRAHERHLLPTIVFLTMITFIKLEYWLFYGAISSIYVLNMLYSYLDLTHRIENIPPATFQVIVGRLVPGIVMLVLVVFAVLMVDFWRFMTQGSHLQKVLLKNGG
jgi:Gpi18-like mannosyltransferase